MENASKALIIAGAILLSILIIALGIYIYNQAKSAMNTDSLTSVELSTFNDPITQYEGPSQIGSTVQSLLSSLISNATTNGTAADKMITVVYVNGEGKNLSSTVSTDGGSAYTASGITGIEDESSNGYFAILGGGTGVNNLSDYKKALTTLRKNISASHNYSISMDLYNSSGYIQQITIDYNNSEESADEVDTTWST